jgi:hypothetical protein
MTRIMAGLVALSWAVSIAGTAAAQSAGITVLRGAGNQSGAAASAAPGVEIVRGTPATRQPAARSGKPVKLVMPFVAAGETLWLRDARTGGLIACWVSGSGYVGRSVIRCTTG